MTTDLHRQPPPPTSETPPPPKPTLDLSLSKIVGGALAAMTADALGSRLSVAGTIIGAALASVIAAVAGALYTASLKRTQDKVRTVWTGRTAGGAQPTRVETVSWDHAPTAGEAPSQALRRPSGPRTASRVSWKGIVVAALAAFGIAAVSLTGYELISGHALSGGTGTTITQAAEPSKPTPTVKKATPSASADPSATAEASDQATSRPSSAPTTTTSSEPTASSTPSASPTATPSATASTPQPSLTAKAEPTP